MPVRIAFQVGFEVGFVAAVFHGGPEGELHRHVGGLAGRGGRYGHRDGRFGVFGGAADVDDELFPARIIPVAVPADQVGGLGQLEHDRALGFLDHRRDQDGGALAKRCLGTHPFRFYRNGGPEHDHDIGVAQHAFGHFVIRLPGAQDLVPPDREAFGGQRLGDHLRLGPVSPAVGKEYARHRSCPRPRA